jgi:hypothetical protein
MSNYFDCWGTRWCSWLKHCTASQKVMVSIPVGITIAMGSTQPISEMGKISWGVKEAGA